MAAMGQEITIISDDVKIDGNLRFSRSVKIDGEVSGDIKSDETLAIGRNAKVRANIKTNNAIISGYFEGKMHASGQVEITSTGKFIGDLIQDNSLLIIEKGGVFKGKSTIKEEKEKK
jgi:cytoskeletal protein CcmA (bactofilin family)